MKESFCGLGVSLLTSRLGFQAMSQKDPQLPRCYLEPSIAMTPRYRFINCSTFRRVTAYTVSCGHICDWEHYSLDMRASLCYVGLHQTVRRL